MTYCINEDDDGERADPLDTASRYELLSNQTAVAAQRLKAAPQQLRLPNGDWPTKACIDCHEPIGPERLEMGRVRCFECQSAKESRALRGLG